MKIFIEVEATVVADKVPEWEDLSNAVMANMPQLLNFGVLAKGCNVTAELTDEELKKYTGPLDLAD